MTAPAIGVRADLAQWHQTGGDPIAEIAAWLLARAGNPPDFFHPKLKDLPPPNLLPNLEESLDLFQEVAARRGRILILGDYDVDGVTSTSLLLRFFRILGVSADWMIPNRFRHGYGLTMASAEEALKRDPELVITVDNGSTSHEEVAQLKERGVKVIILDHHQPPQGQTPDCPTVNPKLAESNYPDSELSGVAVVFLWVAALRARLRSQGFFRRGEPDLKEHLDLVAMGTVADQVPLVRVNRLLTQQGLKLMTEKSQRADPGPFHQYLKAFNEMQKVGFFDSQTLGFKLGPLINAAGRMADAGLAVEFLTAERSDRALLIGRELENLNQQRRKTQQSMQRNAEAEAARQAKEHRGLALFDPGFHEGLIGILAHRFLDDYGLPVLAMTRSQAGMVKGSGRAKGVSLYKILERCQQHFTQWGGHDQAAGFTLPEANLEDFLTDYWAACEEAERQAEPQPGLMADLEVTPEMLSYDLLERLKEFEPFGQANPEPIFLLKGIRLGEPRILAGKHLKWQLSGDLELVYWDGLSRRPDLSGPLDLAGRVSINRFRGQISRQFTLLGWQKS